MGLLVSVLVSVLVSGLSGLSGEVS
jgi:hypothetical protein